MIHELNSKLHNTFGGDTWWYAIPPLGGKYNVGDSITFVMNDYYKTQPAKFLLTLSEPWLQRILNATKDKKSYVHIHIFRAPPGNRILLGLGKCVRMHYEFEELHDVDP